MHIMHQNQAWWLSRLVCGLRRAMACTLIASATLYGPKRIRQIPTYPAFGYLTVILTVPRCTLGDTLGSFWQILYATIQVLPVSILSLMLMKPGDISYAKAAAAVGVSSFMVGLPKSSTLLTKRIAFVEIVLVFVGAVIHGESTGAVMHPLHVGASALLGATASVLALLLPFPRLAYSEVKKKCSLYAANASRSLSLLVKAFCAESQQAAADILLETEYVSKTSHKLIQSIKLKQDSMAREKGMLRFTKFDAVKPGDRLQSIEMPLRGMEMAMNWRSSSKMINQGIIDMAKIMEGRIGLKLEQVKFLTPSEATTAPETKAEQFLNLASSSPTEKDLQVFFFLFCMRLLQDDFRVCSNFQDDKGNGQILTSNNKLNKFNNGVLRCLLDRLLSTVDGVDLMFGIKCSLSLGLAVFLGFHYAKESAYWSGLTIALSFTTGRQPAFTMANARVQGTAFGSVYGVLGCFLLQNHKKYRFLLLLPWIVLISFLSQSHMFGEAWGISAAIGAMLILGRNNYHLPPNIFAINRITEAVIGFSCLILVEILLQPKRASILARIEASNSLHSFQKCVREIKLCPPEKHMLAFPALALKEKHKNLKFHVDKLERLVEEANIEPNFWFWPFNSSIFRKLLNCFSKAVDLLTFIACILETVIYIPRGSKASPWTEFQTHIDEDLKLFSEKLCSSLRVLEDVMSIKSVVALERAVKRKALLTDIETAKPAKYAFRLLSDEKDQIQTVLNSILQHSVDFTRDTYSAKGDQQLQDQIILCLGALGFCINSLLQEVIVMETEIKKLVKWENPTEPIDLLEMSSRVRCLKESIKVTYTSAADFLASISRDSPFLAT